MCKSFTSSIFSIHFAFDCSSNMLHLIGAITYWNNNLLHDLTCWVAASVFECGESQ